VGLGSSKGKLLEMSVMGALLVSQSAALGLEVIYPYTPWHKITIQCITYKHVQQLLVFLIQKVSSLYSYFNNV